MTEKKEPLQVTFAPGCFDNFEGTQEELDALMEEIKLKFENMSPEELERESRSIELDDDNEEVLELMRQLSSLDTRRLQ
jgi:hypothetical protein